MDINTYSAFWGGKIVGTRGTGCFLCDCVPMKLQGS